MSYDVWSYGSNMACHMLFNIFFGLKCDLFNPVFIWLYHFVEDCSVQAGGTAENPVVIEESTGMFAR